MNKTPLTLLVIALTGSGAAFVASGDARAEAPRGTYIQTEDTFVSHGGGGHVLYLNGGGATYYPGWNDAVDNSSSIINTSVTIPPFEQGSDAWEELVQCVKYQFAPFNITVTDVDPSPAAHIEASVGGSASDIGRTGIGGVAPMTGDCSPYSSAIVFNFSEVYPGDMEQLCFTVAQEASHALGLDHVMICEDPMTYLSGCGFKSFKDQAGDCGEFEPRRCRCGGYTQNSVSHLEYWFGAAPDSANPSVAITYPQNGGYAEIGFVATANADDDRAIEKVEFFIDGDLFAEQRFGPYAFGSPANIGLGEHTVMMRVTDRVGNTATDTVTVTVTVDGEPPECAVDDDCGPGRICYNLQCYDEGEEPEEPGDGSLGDPCTVNEDCQSGICASDGDNQRCTQPCADAAECGEGYDCLDAGDTGVCWPADDPDPSTGGCSTSGGTGGLGAFVLLGLVALVRRRRR